MFFCFEIEAQPPAEFINPFIGTANKGNTHPGAVVPWGMVSVTPHTVNSPRGAYVYQNGDPFIYGFGHVQLTGVGCGDAGNLVFMPVADSLDIFNPESRKSTYKNERAEAGYYTCFLEKPRAIVQSTATVRSGKSIVKFDNPKGGIIFDLMMSKSSEKGGLLKKVNDSEVEGYQLAGKFCDMPLTRKVFFVVKVKAEACKLDLFSNNKLIKENQTSGLNIGCFFSSRSPKNITYEISVGISFVSIENARLNLEKEQKMRSFTELKELAFNKWNTALKAIKVEGRNNDDIVKFYTAYYHILQSPNIFNDVNGEYLSMQTSNASNRTIQKSSHDQYTFFSLWDTYRTVHPFLTLVHPDNQESMIKSMLNMYKEGGWLPKWELYGQESWVMVGDPSAIVIGDSYIKDIKNFDTALAWRALQKGSRQKHPQNYMRPGNEAYWQYGYIPIDKRGGYDSTKFSWTNGYVWGTVSTTLEYQLADYNIGIFAKAIGRTRESEVFFNQSKKINLIFDTTTKTFRPKLGNNQWKVPFDTKDRFFDIRWQASGGHGFVEGDAWNYRFFSPHNIPKLINLYGGAKSFTDTLQKLFDDNHFDMSNEPDITYPYLFNYIKGQEWRSQKTVIECINKYFFNTPGGIPGNDDAGTMSAWLVFSMMGIFPDCPGNPNYQIVVPSFEQIKIQLSNSNHSQKWITIKKIGLGNRINKISFNGKLLNRYSISHKELTNGGTLIIEVN